MRRTKLFIFIAASLLFSGQSAFAQVEVLKEYNQTAKEVAESTASCEATCSPKFAQVTCICDGGFSCGDRTITVTKVKAQKRVVLSGYIFTTPTVSKAQEKCKSEIDEYIEDQFCDAFETSWTEDCYTAPNNSYVYTTKYCAAD